MLKNEMKTLRDLVHHRIYISSKTEKNIVEQFHSLYYDSHSQTWNNTYWLGIPTQKCPLDLWIYQEIISEVRPDVIIECGTANGGECFISRFYLRFNK